MMKKAQTHQIFFYIMIIIVVGVIVLIGYKAIIGSTKKACLIEKNTFKNTLKESISNNRNYGYAQNEAFKAPCDAETICFINETVHKFKEKIPEKYKFMRAAVEAKTGENIFLISNSKSEPFLSADKLLVPNEFLCVKNIGGRFHLNIASAGYGFVKISEGSN